MAGSQGIARVVVTSLFAATVVAVAHPARVSIAAIPSTGTSPAAQLVRQALAAEAAGDSELRTAYLRDALAADPNYAPAHWQSGDVRIANRWLSISKATETAQDKLHQYARLQQQLGNTVFDQFRLANFCKDAGLKAQERTHLENVLRLAPTSPEAGRRLGLVMHNGHFIPSGESEAIKERRAVLARTALKISEWQPRLEPVLKKIESSDPASTSTGLSELRAFRSVEALPALELFASERGPETGKAIVSTVADMDGQPATDSLVMHAIWAPHEDVRELAIDALKPRPRYSYVPSLIAALSQPVNVNFQVYSLPDGRTGHRLSLLQEGPTAYKSFVSEGTDTIIVDRRMPRNTRVRIRQDKALATDAKLGAMVESGNTLRALTNQRIATALQRTVKQNFGPNPSQWWKWWDQQNEMSSSSYKPTNYESRYTGGSVVRLPSHHSCFAPGTKVWTPTGLVAIEDFHEGDYVLSQNVDTGKLDYKRVDATTLGPELPLVEIQAGRQTIRCTYGHVFWISGAGWKMAKELAAGDQLHTARGPLLIESVEKRGAAACHNLVVHDFHTYFVTDQAALVHDVNARERSMVTVPGLTDAATKSSPPVH